MTNRNKDINFDWDSFRTGYYFRCSHCYKIEDIAIGYFIKDTVSLCEECHREISSRQKKENKK